MLLYPRPDRVVTPVRPAPPVAGLQRSSPAVARTAARVPTRATASDDEGEGEGEDEEEEEEEDEVEASGDEDEDASGETPRTVLSKIPGQTSGLEMSLLPEEETDVTDSERRLKKSKSKRERVLNQRGSTKQMIERRHQDSDRFMRSVSKHDDMQTTAVRAAAAASASSGSSSSSSSATAEPSDDPNTFVVASVPRMMSDHPKEWDLHTQQRAVAEMLKNSAKQRPGGPKAPLLEAFEEIFPRLTSRHFPLTDGQRARFQSDRCEFIAQEVNRLKMEVRKAQALLYLPADILLVSRAGGSFAPRGEKVWYPTCSAGSNCIIAKVKIRREDPNRPKDPMMALLTPDEFHRCTTDPKAFRNCRRVCIWCQSFGLCQQGALLNNENEVIKPPSTVCVQTYRVNQDRVNGFHRAYTMDFKDGDYPGCPDPIIRPDFNVMYMEYPQELGGAFLLNVSNMIYLPQSELQKHGQQWSRKMAAHTPLGDSSITGKRKASEIRDAQPQVPSTGVVVDPESSPDASRAVTQDDAKRAHAIYQQIELPSAKRRRLEREAMTRALNSAALAASLTGTTETEPVTTSHPPSGEHPPNSFSSFPSSAATSAHVESVNEPDGFSYPEDDAPYVPDNSASLHAIEQLIRRQAYTEGSKTKAKSTREKPLIAEISKIYPDTPEKAIEKFSRILASKPRKKKRAGKRGPEMKTSSVVDGSRRPGRQGPSSAAASTTSDADPDGAREKETGSERAMRINSPLVLDATQSDLIFRRRHSADPIEEIEWACRKLQEAIRAKARRIQSNNNNNNGHPATATGKSAGVRTGPPLQVAALFSFLDRVGLATILSRQVSISDKLHWKPKISDVPCYSDMLRRDVSTSPTDKSFLPPLMPKETTIAVCAFSRKCRDSFLKDTMLRDEFYQILCDVDPASDGIQPRLSKQNYNRLIETPKWIPNRLFSHIYRVSILDHAAHLIEACLDEATDKTVAPTPGRKMLELLHYRVTVCRDAYWFVGYACLWIAQQQKLAPELFVCSAIDQHALRIDVIDPHYDSQDAVHEMSLPVLTDIFEKVYTSSDSESKRSPALHMFTKIVPRRSMWRMGKGVSNMKFITDPRLANICTDLIVCSLLGNYSHLPSGHRPRLSRRCYLYHRLCAERGPMYQRVRTKGPGLMSQFKDIGRLLYHALQQAENFTRRANPYLIYLREEVVSLEEWCRNVDSALVPIRSRLTEPTLLRMMARVLDATMLSPTPGTTPAVRSARSEAYHKHSREIAKSLAWRFKQIDAAAETGSKNLMIGVTVPKQRLGFLNRLASLSKTVAVPALPLRPETRRAFADLTEAQLSQYTVTEESFGLETELLHWIKNIVEICDDDSPFPEGYLFDAMRLFDVPEKDYAHMQQMFRDEEDGKKAREAAEEICRTSPRSYAFVQAFVEFWRRKTRIRIFQLPAAYAARQLAAVRLKAGLRLDSLFIPSHLTSLEFCDVCMRESFMTRELAGKEDVFGKNSGYVNVSNDIDPLRPSIRSFCLGTGIFAGKRCDQLSTRSIDLIGRIVVYNRQTLMICPQHRCGTISEMSRDLSVSTNRGKACSDCSLCLVAASCELEQRGATPLCSTDSAIARHYMSETGAHIPGVVFATRRRSRQLSAKSQIAACSLCDKQTARLTTQQISGVSVRVCGTHDLNRMRTLASHHVLSAERNRDCSNGECRCENLKTTCDGRPNAAFLRRVFQSIGGDSGIGHWAKARKFLRGFESTPKHRLPKRGSGNNNPKKR